MRTIDYVPDGIGTDIFDRMAAEGTRTGPPPGFPQLPDVPLRRYTDLDFFDLERREVFGRSWLFAGHASEFPCAGSFKTLDLPAAPVLVVRGKDGELRAFFNACRHRGAPVVRDHEGTARLLVCQFHSWSYDLQGTLVRVPEEHDFVGLDRDQRCLTPIRLDAWNGLVFINFDWDAIGLEEVMYPVGRRFSDLLATQLRLVDHRAFYVDCNWKVVMEAFLEVYHLKTVHANTAAQFGRSSSAVFGLHPHGVSTMYFPYTDDVIEADEGSFVHQVMFPPDLPVPPGLPDIYRTTNLLFSVFPNLVTPLSPQGLPIVQAWPLAVDRTRFDVRWYGVDWGDGPRPEGWDTKFLAWDVVLQEDMTNLEPIQRSIEAAAHRGIALGYQERALWHLHAAIDRCIGARIPTDLRVPDLLAHLVEP